MAHISVKCSLTLLTGLEINRDSSRNLTEKYEPAILVCKETAEIGKNRGFRCCIRSIAIKLRSSSAQYLQIERNSRPKAKHFFNTLFILGKVAGKWQVLKPFYYQREKLITICKVATPPDILVAK